MNNVQLFARKYEIEYTPEQFQLIKGLCLRSAKASNRLIWLWKSYKTPMDRPPKKAKGKRKHWRLIHKNEWNNPNWFLTFRHGRERLRTIGPDELKKRVVKNINYLSVYDDVWRNVIDKGLENTVDTVKRFYRGICRPPRFKNSKSQMSIGVKNRKSDKGEIDDDGYLVVSPSAGGRFKLKEKPIEAPINAITFRIVGKRLFAVCLYETNIQRDYGKPNKKWLTVDFGMQKSTVFDDKRYATVLQDVRQCAEIEHKKIAKLQRESKRKQGYLDHDTGRRQKPSRKTKKHEKKIQKLWFNRNNKLNDLRHNFSTMLVEAGKTIGYQHDNLKGMQKKKKSKDGKTRKPPQMGKSLLLMGIGEVIRQIEYKAGWAGRTAIDLKGATSKTCYHCRHKNCNKTVNCAAHIGNPYPTPREIKCSNCGRVFDRDKNAVRNMMRQLKLKEY